eukprot:gene5411-biopygen4564
MGQVTPDPVRAATMADAVMTRIVGREALTLAFDDVFRLMAYLFLAALVMVPFCRPPKALPMPTVRKTSTLTGQPDVEAADHHADDRDAIRQALIEGEQSGAPEPFDFATFRKRKSAELC